MGAVLAYIGLDIGTTGAKALLVGEQGNILSTATVEYPLYTPFPLWSEQEPEDWWQASIQALSHVANEASNQKAQIAAIGLTGQMHGAVFLNKRQQVIRRALLWNDQRTAQECTQITEAIGQTSLIDIARNPALT